MYSSPKYFTPEPKVRVMPSTGPEQYIFYDVSHLNLPVNKEIAFELLEEIVKKYN